MLESTNALIGALIAVMRDSDRCQRLFAASTLAQQEEDKSTDYAEQLDEALSDLRDEYVTRQPQAALLTYEELRELVKHDAVD